MRGFGLLVSVALLISAQAHAQSIGPGVTFKGGDLDGLLTGYKNDPGGKRYVGLVQSKPNSSPVPAYLRDVVSGLVDAYQSKRPERYPMFIWEGAKISKDCTRCGSPSVFLQSGFPFSEALSANVPYYMGDKDTPEVRVEWLEKGQLKYLTYLRFAAVDGVWKVWDAIWSYPTVPPIPAAEPTNGSH